MASDEAPRTTRKDAMLGSDDEADLMDIMNNYLGEMDRISTLFNDASVFTPTEVDPQPIIIITWLKSGTTLLQQLVYQLLVASNRVPTDPCGTDFRDISEVAPYIEVFNKGITASIHPSVPTLWKSHTRPSQLSPEALRRAKFIYVVRDAHSAFRSRLDFTIEWIGRRPVPPHLRPEFYRRYFRTSFLTPLAGDPQKLGSWHRHTADWLEQIEGPLQGRVLPMLYNEVVKDMDGAIRTVAAFIGVEADENIVSTVKAKCSRKTMASDTRFHDILVSEILGVDPAAGRRVQPEGKTYFIHSIDEEDERESQEMFERAFGRKDFKELSDYVACLRSKVEEQQ